MPNRRTSACPPVQVPTIGPRQNHQRLITGLMNGGSSLSMWHIVMLSAGVVAASTIGSQAGPCSAEIYSMEARVDATLKTKAADGPTLQESREALLHRQPTPGSIAAAESRIGTASPQMIDAIMRGMARVREADRTGDLNACRRALSDMESLLID